MHSEIFKKFHNLSDSKWTEKLFQSVDNNAIDGIEFPGFPNDDLQVSMVGQSGKNALYESRHIYQVRRNLVSN